jgi:DNA polymerase-3 subunit delta'
MAFALEVAKMLLCPEKPGAGCGKCPACRRVDKQLHADLHVFAPEAGKREIGIDAIRGELIPQISLTPFESKYKVLIIEKADWMTEEAADCLLKTLEEPPPSSVLLLLTEAVDLLQPTIRSRCQIVRLAPPADEDVARELAGRCGLALEQAQALARLADGDMERALAMQEAGWREERDSVFRALAADRDALLALRKEIEEAAASAGRTLEAQRGAIRQKLQLLLVCCRDLLVGGLTQNRDLLFNADAAEAIIGQSGGRRTGQWQRLAEEFLSADDAVLANANLGLLLDLLFHHLSR